MRLPASPAVASRALAAVVAALALALACSERSPTNPSSSASLDDTASTGMPLSDRFRRPTPRTVNPRGQAAPLPPGTWGGERAELVVSGTGSASRLFCAHGAVQQPILVDDSGRFVAMGYLVREGGPTPIDDTPFRRPARYYGWTDGQKMLLEVAVDGDPPLGPFELELGRTTQLGFCPIV